MNQTRPAWLGDVAVAITPMGLAGLGQLNY